jgi:hypothetical protein
MHVKIRNSSLCNCHIMKGIKTRVWVYETSAASFIIVTSVLIPVLYAVAYTTLSSLIQLIKQQE